MKGHSKRKPQELVVIHSKAFSLLSSCYLFCLLLFHLSYASLGISRVLNHYCFSCLPNFKNIGFSNILPIWLSLVFRLLDDLGNEIEMTDSKLQTMLIRVEKVLKLADGKFILHQYNCQTFMLSPFINRCHDGLFLMVVDFTFK